MLMTEMLSKLVNYGGDFTIAAGHPEITVSKSKKGDLDVVVVENTSTGRGYTYTDAGEKGFHATNGYGSAGYIQPEDGERQMLGGLVKAVPNKKTGLTITQE